MAKLFGKITSTIGTGNEIHPVGDGIKLMIKGKLRASMTSLNQVEKDL